MTFARFTLATAPLDQGTVLLEASAGTGKTYTLVGILLRLLLEGQIERLDQALVVTFTKAATEELKTRLRAALVRARAAITRQDADGFFAGLAQRPGADAKLQRALEDFDQAPIATIHGFCKRLLDEAAFESREPFRVDFAQDPLPLLYRAAADVLRGFYRPEVSIGSALLHATKFQPDTLVAQYSLWQRYPDVQLLPKVPEPGPHLATLEAAVLRAGAQWDAAVAAELPRFRWRADENPFGADVAFSVAALAARVAKDPKLALQELCRFAPSALQENLLKKSPTPSDHPFFAACEEVRSAYEPAVEHVRAALLQQMHARLEDDKRRDHVLSFQDLLSRTYGALHDPQRRTALLEALRARYRCALIDEFQDTDALQYGIFATCFAGRPLFLIGDPKQAIYGFRGADLHTYLAARRDAVQQNTLDTNFRSNTDLVAAVGQLFARDDAFVQTGIQMPAVHAAAAPGRMLLAGDPGAALRWRFVPMPGDQPLAKDLAEERIAADVAAEISRLLRSEARLDDRALLPHDIAVLTRTNRQAVQVQDLLRRAGIPSAIGKAGDVFETEELVELERFLQAVLQPFDLQRARAAMATRLWGFDAAALAALDHDEARFDAELARLDLWRRTWIRRGFVVMLEQVFTDLAVPRRLLAMHGGERRLTNFQQLSELLHDAEHSGRLAPDGLLEWLRHERRHQEELDYQLRELRLESDDDAVQILTVHGSKGLEYEVVFCPFLWDARTPRGVAIVPQPDGRQLHFALQENSPDGQRAELERVAEDVRLCYVALTRAKRRCYVHYGAIGNPRAGVWRSALAWLLSPQRAARTPDADGNEPAGWWKQWSERVKKDAPLYQQQLERVVSASGGTMDFTLVPEAPVAARYPAPPGPPLRPALQATRRVHPGALHSFSSLVAGATPEEATPEVFDPPTTAPGAEPEVPATGIFGFARGAAAGLCLHTVLEHADLQAPASAASLVRNTLATAGLLESTAHPGELDPAAAVLQNLRDLAAARVHDDGPTFAALTRGPKSAEWQFLLPTTHSDVRHLARAFADSDSAIARAYAPRLLQLARQPLRGFLGGFVDLLAEHQGRYWVLDWKSNHLGNRLEDYHPAALHAAMQDHDYVLQYHLYVLALHRQLRCRLPDYDYERCMGGIAYVFLRGLVPGSSRGVFYDRVPFALVDAMDQWADGRLGGGTP